MSRKDVRLVTVLDGLCVTLKLSTVRSANPAIKLLAPAPG
jgi:hypothetical protein